MMLLRAGRVVTKEEVVEDGAILVDGERILSVGRYAQYSNLSRGRVTDLGSDKTLIPGLVDLHVHGGGGAGLSSSSAGELERACRYHLEHGTTGLLATVSGTVEEITASLRVWAELADTLDCPSNFLGIHIEGPFINPEYSGAFAPHVIVPPDPQVILEWVRIAPGLIKLLTIAPDLPGALECIALARNNGIVLAAGHTGLDDLDYAVSLGISHVCHTFNAMRPMHHRRPSMLGKLMVDDRVTAEVIGDGIHVHPTMIELLIRAKGADRVCLVTDAIRLAGLADGSYTGVGGTDEVILSDGSARLRNGTLAGSVLTMNRGLQTLVEKGGLPWSDACRSACLTPLNVIGLSGLAGSLEEGKEANLLALTPDFQVEKVWIRGELVHEKI